ncbi:MAG: T9SS type A sorting domain-containing protein [Bacteroidaceae bacterium]|nr:T9SS type A sorting domain-containing protein [Bacteroidaceae bacterium]
MRVKTFLAAMLLMVGTNMMADGYRYLTITFSGSDFNISLPIVQRISFEDNRVVVTTSEGACYFPISVIEKITFTESATAIEALPEQAEDLTYKNGTLSIKGDGLLRIYSTNGALVNIAYVKEGANVSLDKLPAGVYIVRMGDKTIKVRK